MTDFENYKKINKIYNDLLENLSTNDSNFIPAITFSPELNNLYFRFEKVSEMDCAAKLIPLKNVIFFIYFYFTEEPTLDLKLTLIKENFDLFYHEMIHFYDLKRGSKSKYDLNNKTGNFLDRYFNDPMECNAYTPYITKYFFETLQKIEDNPDEREHFKISTKFNIFIKEHFQSFENKLIEKTFINYLNKHNKRRLIKRIYKLYNEINQEVAI